MATPGRIELNHAVVVRHEEGGEVGGSEDEHVGLVGHFGQGLLGSS